MPVVIVAPLYLRKEVEFGVISQAMVAFAQVLGGFSLLVTQFQSLSTFAASISRLDAIAEGIDVAKRDGQPAGAAGHAGIATQEGDRLSRRGALADLGPTGGSLVRGLELRGRTPAGRLLVVGSGGEAKYELFRTLAGVWDHGEGRSSSGPRRDKLMFLPESPYAPPGRPPRPVRRRGHRGTRSARPCTWPSWRALMDRPEGPGRRAGLVQHTLGR